MTRTEGERLVALETASAMHFEAMMSMLDEIKAELKAQREYMDGQFKEIRKEISDDKTELRTLKDKGKGILLGVGLAGGGIGASLVKFLEWLK